MSKHLERDLANLQGDILAMAGAVEAAIDTAVRALREGRTDLAREVIAGDAAIDRQENRVEEECLRVLAVHQPVAGDLRRVAAVLKINTDLERMADLAANMAERAIALAGSPPVPVPGDLERMAGLTVGMVRQSLEAFVRRDTRLARAVCRLDDEVDRLNAAIIRELVQAMRTTPELIEPALSLFSATRHLERIADHATNIAEDVIYLVEGAIVRHRPETLNGDEAV